MFLLILGFVLITGGVILGCAGGTGNVVWLLSLGISEEFILLAAIIGVIVGAFLASISFAINVRM